MATHGAVDPDARTYSNIGLAAAVGYAILDPILSGAREQNVKTAVVDAVIYAEAMAMTWGVTNLARIAVRRPRPQAIAGAGIGVLVAHNHAKEDPAPRGWWVGFAPERSGGCVAQAGGVF